jgi:hypothetical protein
MVGNRDIELTDRSFVEYVNLTNKVAPTWRNGAPLTGVEFRSASPPGLTPAHPRIFIFSSCAAVEKERSAAGVERWVQVAEVQRARQREAASDLGIYSLLGFSQFSSSVNNPGVSKVSPGKKEPGGGSSMLDPNSGLRHKPSHAPSGFSLELKPKPGAIEAFSEEDSDLHPGYLYLTREERERLHEKELEKQQRAAAKEGAQSKKGGSRRFVKKSKKTRKNRTRKSL